jgi:hypothetical protein
LIEKQPLRVCFIYQLSTNYNQLIVASVIGLAPIRPGLKIRLRGLLCIHGQKIFALGKLLFLTPNVSGKILCPRCRLAIPLDDVNVATDIALCRQCGQTWSYADLNDESKISNFIPQSPPSGTWYQETGPRSFTVGSTTRSPIAFFLVPFMCVWSGFSLGGIYGGQIAKGQFNLGMSLFGIPFILGTLLFGSIAVMAVCGKIAVTVNGDDGVIFTGVGPVGWRRRFNWRSVTSIRRTEKIGNRGSAYEQITFEGEKRLNFAAGVKTERLDFMLAILRKKWRESGR